MAGYNSTLKALSQHLNEGESVIASVYGMYSTNVLGSDTKRNGVLAVTQSRAILFGKGMTGHDIETFDLDEIKAVETSKKMLTGHVITVKMSGNSATITHVNKGEIQEVLNLLRDAGKKKAPAPKSDDPIEQLERLAKLRESGAINEEEYTLMKARFL